MEPQFNVVFTGELQPGTDRDAFIQAFSQRFNTDETKAAEVHDAGKAITMKTSVSQPLAEDFKKALEALGMLISLEPVSAASSETSTATTEQQTPAETSPVEGSNPYQAPSAQLEDSPEFGSMTGPVSVPIGSGINWISSAFSNHFKGNAGPWIGAVVLLIVTSMLPLINMVVSLLMPVFIGGLMLGARAQDEGNRFQFDSLFLGFKKNTGQLILLSVLFIVAIFVLMFVFAIVMGVSMALLGGMETGATAPNPLAVVIPMLLGMLVFFPLMMSYWFAPALIAIDNLSAIDAMKLSFFGCLKNILPLLIYFIVLMILMFLAMIPLLLGLLVMMPIMYASMYTAYRDIYYPEA